ncbi:outer membrane beta-barrel protein [Methylocystis sp. IM3]|jgi:outer membrane immunogenic protein|uniref:outer membrane protein n=1 Tax=unclassified Methylocystis TaxID=2625913 RepID=UPI000FBCCFBF|nr:MAG: porin family protein [Hyphomicrobiales bacterium]
MRKTLLSATVFALTAASALAADLPSRKAPPVLPPPPPPPPTWTGFYVGLNAGGTWANSNNQTIAVSPLGAGPFWALPSAFIFDQGNYLAAFSTAASAGGFNSGNNGGFIGGGQIGYNWQFYNNFVVGMEADFQGVAASSASRSVVTNVAVPGLLGPLVGDSFSGLTSVRGSLNYLGTVRGRIGWAVIPTLLVYGTGGFAYGGVTLNTLTAVSSTGPTPLSPANLFTGPGVGGVNISTVATGWTAGGGLEWMFLPNWSAKVEYLYYDLGSVSDDFTMSSVNPASLLPDPAIFGGQVRARLNGNVVRAGVNYHFNWGAPAPIVAKY